MQAAIACVLTANIFDAEPMRKPITHARMEDIARRARVSIMTVSRVLRDPGKVSKETQGRVERAITQVGYVPNELAGGLRKAGGAKLVAAIVPSLRRSFPLD